MDADNSKSKVMEERKEKFFRLFRNSSSLKILYIILLAVIVYYAFNVRTSNVQYLKDVTTGNYTLGPDLDPFLFLRWSKYIAEHGTLFEVDKLRYYPLGYDTSKETVFIPYLIVYVYNFLKVFNPDTSIELAAIFYPAIFFALSIIAFFFFVRRLFASYGENKRNMIAIVSSLFFSTMPSLVHRTVAGIPEKEAAGIFFLFLSLYLFLVSIQSKSFKSSAFFGLLAGLSTGLLGLAWGAVAFAHISIALAALAYFALRASDNKLISSYISWLIGFTIILGLLTQKYGGVIGLMIAPLSGFTYFVGALMIIDILLAKTLYKKEKKLPRIIAAFALTLGIGLIGAMVISPGIFGRLSSEIITGLLHPIGTDRITLTVAENNQPYFSTWQGTFGLNFFWLFFISSAIIFYEIVKNFRRTERIALTTSYILFMLAMIFSRYAGGHIMNGSSAASQAVYFGGFLLFASTMGVIYYRAYKTKELEKIKAVNKEFILLLALFFWSVISARGAIRLFFILVPMVAVLAGFISVHLSDMALRIFTGKEKEINTAKKVLILIAAAIVLYVALNSLSNFDRGTKGESGGTRPSSYNYQWQYAMDWVRKNTPEDSVFSHWWDYGYWIQTLGERATVLDGGNSIGYWDYLTGRHVLTAQNETEALEFLYTHNVTHLLIDSTDIGKYTAYSSIGSDLQYDRYNYINTMILDETQTQETRNETIFVYRGGTAFEENFLWFDSAGMRQIVMPAQNPDEALIAGAVLSISKDNNSEIINQPKAVVYLRRTERIDIPLCYMYYNNQLVDYRDNGPCMPVGLYMMPRLFQSGNQVNVQDRGAALFLNQRATRALWVNLYLLNKSENFELVHSEDSLYIKQLREQGFNAPEFMYAGDVLGPIKIWKVNYPKDIKFKPEYLETSYPDIRLIINAR